MSAESSQPSPALLFETINAFQHTAAIKAAIELDVFSAIAHSDGGATADDIAQRCQSAERGVRILCDYLTILGFLGKSGERYRLTRDSAVFLDKKSPAYMGGTLQFLVSPSILQAFENSTETVRHGTTTLPQDGSVAPEHPMWVDFARGMKAMMAMPAQLLSQLLDRELQPEAQRALRVLDIAAGHGIFGITFAQHHPNAQVTALDSPAVLEVAQQNAREAGVADRFHALPGSAFDVEYGEDYDVILLTNFLHHFDAEANEKLLRKVRAALAPQGCAVTLEFVANDDRVSPPVSASFAWVMLHSTPTGDAYTFSQLDSMLQRAGFARNELHQLAMQQVVISRT